MRKNDLIKLLQTLEGNPEIVLWNGLVGDYQTISSKLLEGELYKQTIEGYFESYRKERCVKENNAKYTLTNKEVDYLTTTYKTFGYEQKTLVTAEDIKEKRYRKKRVVYIQPKESGKTWFNRRIKVGY